MYLYLQVSDRWFEDSFPKANSDVAATQHKTETSHTSSPTDSENFLLALQTRPLTPLDLADQCRRVCTMNDIQKKYELFFWWFAGRVWTWKGKIQNTFYLSSASHLPIPTVNPWASSGKSQTENWLQFLWVQKFPREPYMLRSWSYINPSTVSSLMQTVLSL